MSRPLLFLLTVCFFALPTIRSEDAVKIDDEKDRAILAAFLTHTRKALASLDREHFAAIKVPDTLCWVDLPWMNAALTAYQFSADRMYLREFRRAVDDLLSTAVRGPEGFNGWYGQAHEIFRDPANPEVLVSDIASEFRAVAVLARFAEMVQADPDLREEFGGSRDRYLAFARDHLVKKWDPSFRDLGARGAVYAGQPRYKPAFATMSLPQEKVSIMIEGLLGLYRGHRRLRLWGESRQARALVQALPGVRRHPLFVEPLESRRSVGH